jgi:hypothetical protein
MSFSCTIIFITIAVQISAIKVVTGLHQNGENPSSHDGQNHSCMLLADLKVPRQVKAHAAASCGSETAASEHSMFGSLAGNELFHLNTWLLKMIHSTYQVWCWVRFASCQLLFLFAAIVRILR